MVGQAPGANRHDVEPPGQRGEGVVARGEQVERPHDSLALTARHRRQGIVDGPARLDLDGDQTAAAPDQEVDLANRRADPAAQDPVAFEPQPKGRPELGRHPSAFRGPPGLGFATMAAFTWRCGSISVAHGGPSKGCTNRVDSMRNPLTFRIGATRSRAAVTAMALGALLAACATEPGSVVAPQPQNEAAPQRPAETTPPAASLDLTPPRVETPPPLIVQRTGPPKVAVLVPLSGRAGEVGRALRNAAELALFDIAADEFALAFYDTASDAGTAARVAQQAVDEGASLLVGPLFAASAKAVAPIAQVAGVPVLAFSNDRSAAGSGVWILGLLPDQQVRRVVGYAAARGYSRIGVIAPSNAYGATALSAARAASSAAGATTTRIQTYQPGDPNLSELVRGFANYDVRKAALDRQRAELEASDSEIARRALTRLEGRETTGPFPYDAVLLPEGGEAVRNLAPLMAFYDVDPREVKYLGTALWADPSLGREPTLVNGWFAAPSPDGRAPFVARYRAVFGTAPLGLASLAYDAIGLAAVLARTTEAPDFSAEQLTQPAGFAGADGLFRLLPDGTNQRGLAVLRLTEDGFAVVDPAPQTFSGAIN